VRVRTWTQREQALLSVANSGAVVPEQLLPALTEPFRRLEASRSRATGGYGLGLAVVRAVAEAHGGSVRLVAPASGGLEVTVALPLATGAPQPYPAVAPA